jgi:hypothetical protein
MRVSTPCTLHYVVIHMTIPVSCGFRGERMARKTMVTPHEFSTFLQSLLNAPCFIMFFILCGCGGLFIVCNSGEAMQPEPLIGGRCEYRQYRGTAEIVSLDSVGTARDGLEEEYEVGFLFHPDEEIREQFVHVVGRVFRLEAEGGGNPARRFIDEQGIRAGKRIGCSLRVIIRGTCTPMIFQYPWSSANE